MNNWVREGEASVSAKRCLGLLLGLVAALGAAVSEDFEKNRRLLQKWRADPDHAARLQRDLRDFHALPPERQAQIRQMDRELHALAPREQRRLYGVMERYTLWLERLPEEQRRHLTAAPAAERLQMIRDIRDEQYLEQLPRAVRERVKGIAPQARHDALSKLRKEEKQNNLEWHRLSRPPLPPPPK
jgi:hypothetical protein